MEKNYFLQSDLTLVGNYIPVEKARSVITNFGELRRQHPTRWHFDAVYG